MSMTKWLSASRGIGNLFLRITTVLNRFGISAKRFERRLYRYRAVTGDLGCVPTLPVTAVILKRHPGLISKLSREGIEFAIHGYIHVDYGALSPEEQTRHFRKAIATFQSCQIPFAGFRAPYLRSSSKTPEVLSSLGFLYDSSQIIRWDVVEASRYKQEAWREYRKLLDYYQARSAGDYLSLPRLTGDLVEIPVSIPDDEAMVDRLGIVNWKEIAWIWRAILERTYCRGELFTVQLHPERIHLCEEALADILQQAGDLDPPVWTATLAEIARWWKERSQFRLEVSAEGSGHYRVRADCSGRATLLLKNGMANVPAAPWSCGYQSISARDFVIESPARPVVGVALDSSPEAIRFLESEGFVVERSDLPDGYAIHLTDLADFREADEKPLAEEIERSGAPILRYWRWPSRARSALAITGDIDSITIIDFVLRIFETWRQKRAVGDNGVEQGIPENKLRVPAG